MNILYVAPNEYFPYHQAGFAHIYNICKSLQGVGNKVYIISRMVNVKERMYKNLKIHYVPWTIRDMLFPLIPIRETIKFIKKYEIDVIHERQSIPGGIGVLSSRIFRIPSVLEINSPLSEEVYSRTPIYYLTQLNNKIQTSLASVILTQTPILKSILEIHTKKAIEVVPNAADPILFNSKNGSDVIKKYNLRKKKIITYVGAFTPWHGVDDLILAFKEIKNNIPDSSLLLIGKGKGFDETKALVKSLGLMKDVIFTGPIAYDEIPEYLSISDVLVAPFNTQRSKKRVDAFRKYGLWWSPVKLFEYMAMAKPIVATSLGMVPEYIKGAGLLFREGNIEDLSLKIIRLLENDELSKKLGKQGRKNIIKKYNWGNQAEKIMKIYEKLLDK